MSAATRGAEDFPEEWTVDRALELLGQALEIVDYWGDCPAIGARLQHVIDEVAERRER